ncbi:C27A7.1 [Bugula neritina]|uniref:C27A7.1 n=1 Tax=Bugula neritina TaxID=10212 RepID=A0A7J7JNM3_BUGNE|nr:C27A7.1 [Bugula neritina]
MATALISNVHLIRGETIVNLKNLVQAGDGRDALAKALYSRLFGWIISKINNKLKPDLSYAPKKSSCPVIGLLDIAGFENFTSNSFEQLCINTSNEQLQHYFNQHVFAWEKRDLDKEGVKTSHISFTNNSEILGMFIERPLGLYALIDEESKFPKATANSLLEKVRKHLIKYSCIKKEKGREPLFTIQHYAGPVTYSVSGMLETNRDTLSQNILECLERSESGMIYQLFSAQFSDNGELSTPNQELRRTKSILMCKQPTLERGKSLSKTAGRKVRQNMKKALKEIQDDSFYKHRTVGSQFQDSLAALMTKLMQCQPHFIRCIKPNTSQASQLFERKLVSQQLRYTGILETVRIRHEGFPVRLSFQVFLDRYKFISYPLTAEVEAGTAACHTVLREAGLHKWELGTRKVFLRYWHPEQLKLVMERRVRQVVLVQSLVRRFIGCRKVQQLRQILEARKQAQAKSFLMMVAERSQQMHADLKELHNLDVTKHKQSLNNLAREAEESKIREQMIEEKRRKLALAEAEREKKAAELRLAEAQKRIEELETTRKVETPSSISSSSSSGFEDDLPSPKLSKEEPKHTWRKQRANHKDHVAGLRNLLESKAEPPDQENVRLNKQKWVPISERLYATPACPYGVARKSPARPLHLQSIFSDPSHGQVYDPENVSHYARQSSHSKILVNKVEHYNGMQLQIDTEGDIWAKKLGMNDIIVQDHNDPSLSCISEEVIKDRGRLQKDKRVKIFDMKEFRSHVILEMHKAGLGRVNLKDLYSRCCIVSLTLVKSSMGIMETPCWINIINLGALRMLRDENVMADFEKELKKIMRSNIDFTKISQLPQIDKQKPKKTDKKKGKLPQRKNQEADKVFVLPEPVLDRASKPVGDFQFKSPRKWAKLKQNGVSQLTE